MKFTDFGERFRSPTGIGVLMEDLAKLKDSERSYLLLGGGNPGRVPEAVSLYRSALADIAADSDTFFDNLGSYADPGGSAKLISALVNLFNTTYNWNVKEENIVLTNGSQNAFFLLFNLLAGTSERKQRKILLPMTPEYIGYEDVSIGEKFFVSQKPLIDVTAERRFKYRVDLDSLQIKDDIGALCVSRPTNPTGNVVTDNELAQLDHLAQAAGIPLIIDNAYGEPFPNIIHKDVTLHWHENIILSMSLSKLGLPAVRTGIIVAAPEIVQAMTRMNAVINLTPGSLGPAIIAPLFESGRITDLSKNHIQPFYRQKSELALSCFDKVFQDVPAFAHVAEGAIFLWAWFKDLPITAEELYQRLVERGVIVVPGHYFFPGIDNDWRHSHECIRICYAMEDHVVESGIEIIADEVKKAYL